MINRCYLTTLCLITIFCLPLFFLFGSHEWLYTPYMHLDAYIDHTFSFFYDQAFFRDHYYRAARVPWVASIFYLQKMVGPHLLSPVLAVGNWLIISFLYFQVLKNVFDLRRSFVLLPWIIFFPYLTGYAAGGIVYNSTFAVWLFLLALLLWVKRDYRWLSPFFCGLFLGSAVHTNIILLNLLVLFPIIDRYMNFKFELNRYLKVVAGVLFATLIWGLVNHLHGRPFLFFFQMLQTASELVGQPQGSENGWIHLKDLLFLYSFDSYHLIFSIALYLTALAKLLREFFTTRLWRQNLFTMAYAGLFTTWILWQLAGRTTLHPPDFSYPLQVAAVLMLAGWLQQKVLDNKDIYLTFISSLFLWCCLYFSDVAQSAVIFENSYGASILGALLFLLLLLFFFWSSNDKFRMASLIGVGLIYSLTSFDQRSNLYSTCSYREDGYKAAMNIVSQLPINRITKYVVYGNTTDEVIPLYQCARNRILMQNAFPKLAATLNGTFLGPFDFSKRTFEKKISDFQPKDFHTILNKNDSVVLFPFDSKTFSAEFLKKTAEFGYKLKLTARYEETVGGHKIPWEIYDSEPKLSGP